MSRTEGSGWGGGTLFYQVCPKCEKKKVLYSPIDYGSRYKCTSCRERFDSDKLLPLFFLEQYENYIKEIQNKKL
jgi:hypothetical protein